MHKHQATCLFLTNPQGAPRRAYSCAVSDRRQLNWKLGQPEPCDGGEESVVDVVGELGVQVDVEAAGHTVLALAPGKSALVMGQPNATESEKIVLDKYLENQLW